MRRRHRIWSVSRASAWVGAGVALGAAGVWRMGVVWSQPVLTPVDQGYADQSPLSTSLRRVDEDLRLPLSFDRLYRFEGRPRPWPTATGDRSGWFARVSGGVVAMFPQSQYTQVGSRARRVDVPAGTVYLLQDSRGWMGPAAEERDSGSLMQRLNESAGLPEPRLAPVRERAVTLPALPQHSVWQSEAYRQRRIGELLDAALLSQ